MIIVENVFYENQCYENYFYGDDAIWENKLSQMEAEWKNVIQKINDNSGYTLDRSDEKSLKNFALYQRQRTYAEFEHNKAMKREAIEAFTKAICSHNGWQYSPEIKKWVCDTSEKETHPEESLKISENVEPLLNDLDVRIIQYETEEKLVFSDMPVIMINPFCPTSVGLSVIGIVIFFPISINKLVVIYDPVIFNIKGIKYSISRDENEVKELNSYQFVSAHSLIFSSQRLELDHLVSISDKLIQDRNVRDECSAATQLGPPENSVVHITTRKLIRDSRLSFCKLPKYVDRIGHIGREAIPRKYEKGWENKLKLKEQIMPTLYKDRVIDSNRDDWANNAARKAYSDMTKFAMYYWDQASSNEENKD